MEIIGFGFSFAAGILEWGRGLALELALDYRENSFVSRVFLFTLHYNSRYIEITNLG